MLRNTLKFIVGVVAGGLVWWYFGPPYNGVLAELAVRLLRVDPRAHDLLVAVQDRGVFLRSLSDSAPTMTLPASDVTYNVLLYFGMVAATERWWRLRKGAAIGAGLLFLFVSHVITLVVMIEATYAASEPYGSHWGSIETNIWFFAMMFLRLVGMIAIAFACWIFAKTHGGERTGEQS